ncbi:YkvA family protein [Amorphus sp. 3PC139-8]|uniref:YkvA family protein n=1 Tax=Amorphus sp. 3PC139-8 TaxID=2735676 RepID=UPI00345D8197
MFGKNRKKQEPEILPPDHPFAQEDVVRNRFWRTARRAAGQIPFVEDLVAAYYCALDPATPMRVRGMLMGALGYFVLPTDLIPDVLLGFGFTDDASVLIGVIALVSTHIKDEHRQEARRVLDLDSLKA